jgi:hypothetical protein
LQKAFLLGRLFWLQPEKTKGKIQAKDGLQTPYGVYSYQAMPFDLKNAGATY